MKNTNIRDLATVRDLLAELDVIRADIIKGNVQGWAGMMRDSQERDTVYIGGTYKANPRAAARALMKIAAARALLEDQPEEAEERPRLRQV